MRIKRERLCAEADSPLTPARDVGEVLAIGDLRGEVLVTGDCRVVGELAARVGDPLFLSGEFTCFNDDLRTKVPCLGVSSSDDAFRSDLDEFPELALTLELCLANNLFRVFLRVSLAQRACFLDWTTTIFWTEKSLRALRAAF